MTDATGKAFMQRMCMPGWKRRITISLIVLAMVALCVGFVSLSGQEDGLAALGIFIVSVLGFSLVAAISYDATMCWRLVDLLWVGSSFAAIVIALLTIEEAANRERASSARSEITDSFSGLLFAVQSIVTNDCEKASSDDVRPRSPEPYQGACDRMKHLLPEMTYQYDVFSRSRQVSSLKDWSRNVVVSGAVVGSWANLNDTAARFVQTADRLGPLIESQGRADPLHRFLAATKLKYWYFILAFFVGFRLSRTTAEILQIRAPRSY